MLLQAKTTIQQPRGVVWKIFTNPKTWEKWWGGVLQKVDPDWQENGYLRWEKGSPSRIAEFVPLERVRLISQSSGMKSTFTFTDVGNASTLVVYEEDYSGSTLSVANPSAKQAQCDSTVADFKRYVESAAGQAAVNADEKNRALPALNAVQKENISNVGKESVQPDVSKPQDLKTTEPTEEPVPPTDTKQPLVFAPTESLVPPEPKVSHKTSRKVVIGGVLGGVVLLVLGGIVLLVILGLGHKLGTNKNQVTTLPTAIGGGTGRIAFSAEYDGNRDIYVMDVDASNVTRLTNNEAWDWSPTWSPDGRQIAFLSMRDGNPEIYIMDANGENVRRLTNNQSFEGYPAWSPDGKNIAFVSDRDEPDPAGCGNSAAGCNSNIFVININSLNETRLTDSPSDDEGASWSPDGKHIAFFSTRDGNAQIYVMDANGSNVTRLTNDQDFDWRPSWSPDGKHIAFMSYSDGKNVISVMNTDGSNVTRLTDSQTDDSAPSWSPDGQHIAFHSSSSDGNTKICIMDFNGSNMTCLTNNLTNSWEPAWQPFTPSNGILPTSAFRSTSVPPTGTLLLTETRTPTSIPLPTEVTVLVSPAAMDVISSWNSSIHAFTPANNPVTNLLGLAPEDVGFWNNSRLGMDLYREVVKLLDTLGTPWNGGLYACPNVNEAFTSDNSCSLRIYFTDDSITEVDGGARVIFQSNP